jgi:GT2 family glycosyltransferase
MRNGSSVAISIVNYNTRDLLAALLRQLTSQQLRRPLEIIVVDNASRDGSADMVSDRYPEVTLVRNEVNRGFGAAHNQALQQHSSSYWLVLNPDVTLGPGDIDSMVNFMEQRPRCGIEGCRLIGPDGAFQPSAGQFPFGTALFGWLFNLEALGVRANLHRIDPELYARSRPVDWVSGACMLIRSDVARHLGGFDERYFLYFEDIDLCYRARKAGYLTVLNSDVAIGHLGGASTPDPRFDQWLGSLTGSVRFYERHRGSTPARIVRVLIMLAVLARAIAYWALGSHDTKRTYVQILRSLGQPNPARQRAR